MRVHQEWLLTPQRAAVHLPTATAVLADLHLDYDHRRRRGGDAVPARGLDEVLAPLRSLIVEQDVRRLVIAGDLFEDARHIATGRELLSWLIQAQIELLGVVPGNHDRGLASQAGIPLCPEGIRIGRWRVLHGDQPLPPGPVVLGHNHPCFRWGETVSAPCYLVAPRRLVLPAFSADAAGVNVLRDSRWRAYRSYVIAGTDVLDFGIVGELPVIGGRRHRK